MGEVDEKKLLNEKKRVVAEDEAPSKEAEVETAAPLKKKRKHSRRKYEDLEPVEDDEDSQDEDKDKDLDDDKLVVEDDEEDDLLEIDTSNIITTGRRTRGKVVDYTKVEAELAQESKGGEEDEEEDDKDFEEKADVKGGDNDKQ